MSSPPHEFGEVSVVLGGLDKVEYGIKFEVYYRVKQNNAKHILNKTSKIVCIFRQNCQLFTSFISLNE